MRRTPLDNRIKARRGRIRKRELLPFRLMKQASGTLLRELERWKINAVRPQDRAALLAFTQWVQHLHSFQA